MSSLNLMNALDAAAITKADFLLNYGQETSGQASGQIRVRDLRSPIWMASFTSDNIALDRLEDLKGLIESLSGSRGTFYAWSPSRQYPRNDPAGSILGSASVQINALNGSDLTRISLKGLPPGYVLRRGDMFAFDYTATTTRRALHRIITSTVTANGSGVTPEFEVRPPFRAGAAVNASVNLKRPAAEFCLTPQSVRSTASGVIGSLSFDVTQVI